MGIRKINKEINRLGRFEKQLLKALTHEIKFENRGNARLIREALEKIDRHREYLEDKLNHELIKNGR